MFLVCCRFWGQSAWMPLGFLSMQIPVSNQDRSGEELWDLGVGFCINRSLHCYVAMQVCWSLKIKYESKGYDFITLNVPNLI